MPPATRRVLRPGTRVDAVRACLALAAAGVAAAARPHRIAAYAALDPAILGATCAGAALQGGLLLASARLWSARLGPALRGIGRALPGPSPAVLAAAPDPVAFLNGRAHPTDADLAAAGPSTPLPSPLTTPPALAAAIAADPAAFISSRLYTFLLPEGGDLEATAWAPGVLASPAVGVSADGLAAVDESAADALTALRFAPGCRPAWAALALLYGGAADALLEDAARGGVARPGGRRACTARLKGLS